MYQVSKQQKLFFIKFICPFPVHVDDKVQFDWFAENSQNSDVNITKFEEDIINGFIKNVTSIATIVIDQKSSIRKATVSMFN